MAAEQSITGSVTVGPAGGGVPQNFSLDFPADTTNVIRNIFITTDDPAGITLIKGSLSGSDTDLIFVGNSIPAGTPLTPISPNASVVCMPPNNSLNITFTLNTNDSNLFFSIHYVSFPFASLLLNQFNYVSGQFNSALTFDLLTAPADVSTIIQGVAISRATSVDTVIYNLTINGLPCTPSISFSQNQSAMFASPLYLNPGATLGISGNITSADFTNFNVSYITNT